MSEYVTTHDTLGPQYLLLQPGVHPARTGRGFQVQATYRDIDPVLTSIKDSRIVAVDFETIGGDYTDPSLDIVGMGLAWDTGSCYFHWADLSFRNRDKLLDAIGQHPGTIAHNVYFDGGVFYKIKGYHAQWSVCTYALLAMLSNESPEMKWGLKDAMVNLLGWTGSNEDELDEWLVVNGYYRGARRTDNSPEYLRTEYLTGGLKPEKGYMWKAPADILGKYCVLDAEATYLLYTEVLEPVTTQFDGMMGFLPEFMRHIIVHITQRMHGIPMNRKGLHDRKAHIVQLSKEYTDQFMTDPRVQDAIRAVETTLRAPLYAKVPTELKKDGKVSKNFLNWKERIARVEAGELPEYNFNIQSAHHLRAVLYDHLGNEVRMTSEKGEPSTSVKALKNMGDLGNILMERQWLLKESGFIDAYIEMTEHRETIHPSFRMPGTVTGRLSSKTPNLQQVPKTKSMMRLFQARPGHVWVDLDFSALEPVVATEFSQDPNMLAIYGDGRPSNDIYLFTAASIPGMADRIRATGYDPYSPTKEALARAKKECKADRSVCKTVVLACQYGAGVNKIVETLEADNIFLEYHEVAAIHSGYWDLFAKVKDFARGLLFQWKRNGGYILNGMGRPMAVAENYSKDLLNRFVQSTGHDILVQYANILADVLNEMGIPWMPLIMDFHDATTVEVPEEYADRTVAAFNEALVRLNKRLGGTITLRGVAVVGTDLAMVKEPENE